MTRSYRLLGILIEHATTGKEQGIATTWYHKTREEITADIPIPDDKFWDIENQMEKTLINALADGINHGNWPWT